jgi:hypothetical protein
MSDDLIKRLREGRTTGSNLRWSVTDIHREAAAALSEAQATIARLEAALREARAWIDDWPDPRYGTTEDGEWRKQVLAQIDAALSPREGEGT